MDSKGILVKFVKFSSGTWINALIALISMPLISWLILPDEFGKATMFTLAHGILLNVTLLGGDQSFLRFYFEKKSTKKSELLTASIKPGLLLFFIISTIAFLFRDSLSLLIVGEFSTLAVLQLLVAVFFGIILTFGLAVFRVEENGSRYSIIQVLQSGLNVLILILVAKYYTSSYLAITTAFSLSIFIVTIIVIILQRRLWIQTIANLFRGSIYAPDLLHYGLPLVPTFILDWIFQSSDRYILKQFCSFEEVGVYSMAIRISVILNLLRTGFTLFWTPYSLGKYTSDQTDYSYLTKTFNILVLFFSIAICCLVSIRLPITNIISDDYHSVIEIFPWLLLVPMLYTLSEVTVSGVVFKKKSNYHFIVAFVVALLSVSLSLILIPAHKIFGAALSMVITYFCFFILRTIFSARLIEVSYDFGRFLLTLITLTLSIVFADAFMIGNLISAIPLIAVIIILIIYKTELISVIKLTQ